MDSEYIVYDYLAILCRLGSPVTLPDAESYNDDGA